MVSTPIPETSVRSGAMHPCVGLMFHKSGRDHRVDPFSATHDVHSEPFNKVKDSFAVANQFHVINFDVAAVMKPF